MLAPTMMPVPAGKKMAKSCQKPPASNVPQNCGLWYSGSARLVSPRAIDASDARTAIMTTPCSLKASLVEMNAAR